MKSKHWASCIVFFLVAYTSKHACTWICFLPRTRFLTNCQPTSAVPFQSSRGSTALFTPEGSWQPKLQVIPSLFLLLNKNTRTLTSPRGLHWVSYNHNARSQHIYSYEIRPKANKLDGWGPLMLLFSSWPNPRVLATQKAWSRSTTQPEHVSQSLAHCSWARTKP